MNGRQLRELRAYHGLSQSEVAQAAGLHQSDVSAAESGRRTSPELLQRVLHGVSGATRPSRAIAMHRDVMREYLSAEGITGVLIFGSTARGEDSWDSDIDLLATLPPGSSLFDLVRWEADLRRLAGGIKVELVPDGPRTRAKLGDLGDEATPL